ncbi:Uncharacterised protein [uncultured archaeon]|nr:Uncharacterised protein [uncultured archaeon]
MIQAKQPKKTGWSFAILCSGIVTGAIHLISIILLLISGVIILLNYYTLLSGILLTELQKTTLDYSITIFAGSAIYLLLYTYEVEKIVKRLFNVREVELIE